TAAKIGKYPQAAIMQNHGIFIAADTVDEIDCLMNEVVDTLKKCVKQPPDFGVAEYDRDLACRIAPALRMLYDRDGAAVVIFCVNKQVSAVVKDADRFSVLVKPFSPDHIVYCKDEPLFVEPNVDFTAAFTAFAKRKGYAPKIVAVRGLGFFALGETWKAAENARILFLDAVKIAKYSEAFGGANPLTDELTNFILTWESEKYRIKAATSGKAKGRLAGKIALITGGAQGFGKGIAAELAAEGAYVAIADLNAEGAAKAADELSEQHGSHAAIGVKADVSDEESVKAMVAGTVLAFGGLDVLVSNAGVLIAGGLEEMTKKSFDLVTAVNYTGYFLCAKYAAEPMKIQNSRNAGYMSDIIEINSKSGLEGSNKNFAYAGSKFGGVGLTQSFAKELVGYGIKVNAICPGNLLDGPLWSDPERGLFKQYLDSGKVPGAQTLDDVRRHYENLVPMKRGCTVMDVARAIFYLIEQKYETGQALPVTGGQVMLS
ncbi:MAG: SDR family NAD(P)-dependent oxidoreductase, partial [Defluviitaleaceae bacterium]|nr:SDR family NAD(P)-dependent oxidoreductase [Defluviitaleaceae bacterium]